MRILFVVGEFPAISETFVLDQITGLIDRGLEVEVLARRPHAGSPVHRAVEDYQLLSCTHYYPANLLERCQALPQLARWFAAAPLGALRALMRSLRVDLYGPGSLALEPLQRAAAARGSKRFDAVIAHFGPNGLKALQLRELGITNAPIMTLFHAHDLSRWTKEHGAERYRRLFSRGDLMLPISQHGRDRLVSLGCSVEKICVHRMGVNVSSLAFVGSSVPRAPATEVNILSVGRLVEKKGFEHGLRGVGLALSAHPNLHYHVVGDGPLRPALEALAERLDMLGRVTFHGHLARDRVEALRRRANVMLVPSVTAGDGDEEGIPVVVMEAMASGVPVIATRHAGIPELVIDGETGLLVPERDGKALADALGRLIREPGLHERLRQAARAKVAAQHDVNRLNDELTEILKKLTRRRSADI